MGLECLREFGPFGLEKRRVRKDVMADSNGGKDYCVQKGWSFPVLPKRVPGEELQRDKSQFTLKNSCLTS